VTRRYIIILLILRIQSNGNVVNVTQPAKHAQMLLDALNVTKTHMLGGYMRGRN
jgi:hypothetical protein